MSAAEAAYAAGRAARRSSPLFSNPFPTARAVERNEFANGWAWENYLLWRAEIAPSDYKRRYG